jgi:hypothetical protein
MDHPFRSVKSFLLRARRASGTLSSMKQKFLRSILPVFLVSCAATAFLFGGAATLLTTGCKSSSTNSVEQTALTASTITVDAADVALKVWAQSFATRQATAVASNNTAALASLATEQATVQTALTAYQTAFRAAILGWVASKDAQTANAAPSAAILAGFSAAFASASQNLVAVLQSFK